MTVRLLPPTISLVASRSVKASRANSASTERFAAISSRTTALSAKISRAFRHAAVTLPSMSFSPAFSERSSTSALEICLSVAVTLPAPSTEIA